MIIKIIFIALFVQYITTQNQQNDKDRQLCEQLAQFTPNLCNNNEANTRCVEQCGDGITPPALDCGLKLDEESKRKRKQKNKKQKMKKLGTLTKRIVGGDLSEPGEWPWQVLLQHRNGSHLSNISFCGGAILSRYFILTAAHCRVARIDFPKNVYVGEYDRSITQANEKVHKIKKMVLHRNYRRVTSGNDIAIIQLENPIRMEDENKGRICLPDDDNPISQTQECYVTGWGHIQENGFPSNRLNEARVLRIPTNVCNLPMSYNGIIDDTMICAGFANGGTDACQNDSGGSLACHLDSTDLWYTTGTVSFGLGCGRRNKYGVYGNVTHFKDWIIETILNESDDL